MNWASGNEIVRAILDCLLHEPGKKNLQNNLTLLERMSQKKARQKRMERKEYNLIN